MKIHLHKNARTTPSQREWIQNCHDMNIAQLAARIGVSETTVRKWKKRDFIFDRSHVPQKIYTAFSPEQEVAAILIRICLNLGLDDLLTIVRHFFEFKGSRSSLNRCLKRYRIPRLPCFPRQINSPATEHLGTFMYYNTVIMPFKQGVCRIDTLMDCRSGWTAAHLFFPWHVSDPSSFLGTAIKEFPAKVLGVVYAAPVCLWSILENANVAPVHQHGIETFCSINQLTCREIENCTPETLSILEKNIEPYPDFYLKTDTGRHQGKTGLSDLIQYYNNTIRLKKNKQKTPADVLWDRYREFPGSFKFRPEQSGGTF